MRPFSSSLMILILLALVLPGCAQPTATELRLGPGEYPVAFTTARDVLRDARFDIDRVDGRAGVIVTYPKPSAGLATPWDLEQSTAGQEIDDLLNYQQYRVRVTFEPALPPLPPPQPPAPDSGEAAAAMPDLSRAADGETVMRIRVIRERIERSGWRPASVGIAWSTRFTDLALREREIGGNYIVPIAEDPRFAARLTERVRRRLQEQQAGATPEREPGPSADQVGGDPVSSEADGAGSTEREPSVGSGG